MQSGPAMPFSEQTAAPRRNSRILLHLEKNRVVPHSFLYKNEKKKIEPIVRDISSPREQSAQKARRDEMLEFIQSNEIVKKLNRYSNTGNPVTVTNEISAYKHALRQLCYPDILMGFHKRGQNIYVVKRGKTKQVLEYWLKINEENTVNVALNDTK